MRDLFRNTDLKLERRESDNMYKVVQVSRQFVGKRLKRVVDDSDDESDDKK